MANRKSKAGPNFVTQSDLAGLLGLSRSTVAAALNPNSPVRLKPETVAKVRETAARLNYQPHRHASIMRSGRSYTIGVIGGVIGRHEVHYERMKRLATKFRSAGYELMVCSPSWYQHGVRDAVVAMLGAKVEGVLITSCFPEAEEIEGLLGAGVPTLILSSDVIPGLPAVVCDIEGAMFRLTKHLIRQGCRDLVFCSSAKLDRTPAPLPHAQILERALGFSRAILEAGGYLENVDVTIFGTGLRNPGKPQQPDDPRTVRGRILTVRATDAEFDPFLPGRMAFRKLREQGNKLPDALVCTNDDWALGAMNEAFKSGVRVPEDMAITGFDNTAMCTIAPIPLTSVSQPIPEMIDLAADLLLGKLVKPNRGGRAKVHKLPCKLVLRESTGDGQPG